jgi:O-glycosyl hydrolase
MKKQIFYYFANLILLTCLFMAHARAQHDTSFSTTFGPGEPVPNMYAWAGGFQPSVDTDEGVLVVDYNKVEAPDDNRWDRLVHWVGPFDIRSNPFYFFRLKSDTDRNLLVVFKDLANIEVSRTVQLIGDNEFRDYFFDLRDALTIFNDPDNIREIQFDLGYGVMSGTLVFDEIRLGDAANPGVNPPTIDSFNDLIIAANSPTQQVELTGISDGDGITGPVEITAETDNLGLILNLSVDYTYPETTAFLSFDVAPDVTGEAVVTLILTDEGEYLNTTMFTFNINVVEPGGSGFVYSFDEPTLPSGLSSSAIFSVSVVEDALRVAVGRNGNRWGGLLWDLDITYDITENPYLNLLIRTDQDQVMQVFLVDAAGNGYEAELIQTQFAYHELVAGKNVFRQNRLLKGNKYVLATYDFTGADPNIIDLSKIAGIRFVSNGTALTFHGVHYIDEIRMGDQATKSAYIAQVPDHSFYINTDGKQTVLVPDIKNAMSLEISGADDLIENVEILPITYNEFVENGRPVRYGYSKIQFDIKEDAVGTEAVTLLAKGEVGFADNSINFDITISDNLPPTLDKPDDMIAKVGDQQHVSLSGISDGDRDVVQEITFEVSSGNTDVINDFQVNYTQLSRYGDLIFTPIAPGVAEVTVTVKDSEDAEIPVTFIVNVYESLNGVPTIDQIEDITVYNNDADQVILLTGIHDGENGSQQLTITAVSSDPAIVPDPVVNYTQGSDTAELIVNPIATETGMVSITVTVADDGGTDENNGDQQTTMTFGLRSMIAPVTGFTFDLEDPNILELFKPEAAGVTYFLDVVDTLGSKALRVKMKDKWTFGGIWVDFPQITDLSEYPIISYDVLSIDNQTYHWNYFYDAHGTDASVNRNIQNSNDRKYPAPANEWTTLSFDYRYPGDMNNSQGVPIDGSLIQAVLINLHDHLTAWPFTDYTGVVYIRNIAVGDEATFSPMTLYATIDQVPEQVAYLNDGIQHIYLTGISNGDGSTEGITFNIESSQSNVIPVPVITSIQDDGTALLSFEPNAAGVSTINITVSAEGSETVSMNFRIRVLDPTVEAAVVTIDRAEKHQIIHGLGTFENQPRWADLYATELGASAVRIGIISNQFEPVNDNNDPYVLNMAGFNYDAFDFDYFRDLKEKGVETFILTSWSPPAWMKRNLSLDHREQAVEWEKTDNILEPYYYEEFAEMMVAVVRAFKDEADIDIKAIGLQNEPFFNEPYASAILSGQKFAELIEVVGNRFALEGLDDVGFFMPEQVFGLGWGDYSNEGYLASLRANPVADAYTDFFAVHGYDGSGITAGFPTYTRWKDLFNLVQTGDNPKELWMTETHIGYQGWNSAIQLAGALHGSLWAGNISLWTNWSFGDMQLTRNSPNSSFYTSMNYFKYIRPGAVRVETESNHEDVLATAFENEDGRFVVVLINKGNLPVSVQLTGADLPPAYRAFRTSANENFVSVRMDFEPGEPFILPASSVTTFITEELFMSQVPDMLLEKNSEETIANIVNIANVAGTTDGLTLSFDYTNAELFESIMLSGINTDGTANVTFTPTQDAIGFSKVTLTLYDDHGNSKEVIFFINVVDSGVNVEKLAEPRVLVYPNPARDYVIVELESERFEHVRIMDINGRVIVSQPVNSSNMTLNTSGLRKGIYFIEAGGRDYRVIRRLIIH